MNRLNLPLPKGRNAASTPTTKRTVACLRNVALSVALLLGAPVK